MNDRTSHDPSSRPPGDRQPDERLADWVDGCMSPRDRERFTAELRVNAQLRADLAAYERTVAAVRQALQAPTQPLPRSTGSQAAGATPAGSSFADRVVAQLQAAPERRPRLVDGGGIAWRPVLWSLCSAAALLVLALWIDTWSAPPAALQTQSAGNEPPAPLDRLVAAPAAPVAADKSGTDDFAGASGGGGGDPAAVPGSVAPAEELTRGAGGRELGEKLDQEQKQKEQAVTAAAPIGAVPGAGAVPPGTTEPPAGQEPTAKADAAVAESEPTDKKAKAGAGQAGEDSYFLGGTQRQQRPDPATEGEATRRERFGQRRGAADGQQPPAPSGRFLESPAEAAEAVEPASGGRGAPAGGLDNQVAPWPLLELDAPAVAPAKPTATTESTTQLGAAAPAGPAGPSTGSAVTAGRGTTGPSSPGPSGPAKAPAPAPLSVLQLSAQLDEFLQASVTADAALVSRSWRTEHGELWLHPQPSMATSAGTPAAVRELNWAVDGAKADVELLLVRLARFAKAEGRSLRIGETAPVALPAVAPFAYRAADGASPAPLRDAKAPSPAQPPTAGFVAVERKQLLLRVRLRTQ
jgi:hypothetical protein